MKLETKSAIDSDEGLALQAESLELEVNAEEIEAKTAAEMILGDEFADEAEVLHGFDPIDSYGLSMHSTTTSGIMNHWSKLETSVHDRSSSYWT